MCGLLYFSCTFPKANISSLSFLYYHTQKKNRVKIWLYEDTRMTIEGQIIGFDEYMNFVLDGATEIDTKTGKRTDVGRILLKGDAITLMQEAVAA